MRSELPKVLVPVCGRPMIDYVLDAVEQAGITRALIVVGYRAELVRAHLATRRGVEFAEQTEQLGTGHAVMMCRAALAGHAGPIVVLAGDSPMIQPSSLKRLLGEYDRGHPACILGTAHKNEPAGLGRIVRDASRNFLAIVEEKDATPEQRQITEVNLSCYVFDGPALFEALAALRPDNAQGEYYLTDCPRLLRESGREVRAADVLSPAESLSINNADELGLVEEAIMAQQSVTSAPGSRSVQNPCLGQ